MEKWRGLYKNKQIKSMKLSKKFTFKTVKPTGKYKSFYNPHYTIFLGGQDVGEIRHEFPHKIRLKVIKEVYEDGVPNCKWKWVQLVHESASINEAKKWANEHFEAITKKYKLNIN